MYRKDIFNITTGGGYSDVDRKSEDDPVMNDGVLSRVAISRTSTDHEPSRLCLRQPEFPNPVTWTLGVSYDHYDENDLKVEKVNPKFGVQWNVTNDLVLRGAVFRVR